MKKRKSCEFKTADKLYDNTEIELKTYNNSKFRQLIFIIISIFSIIGVGFAISFASITGYATVDKAIKIDIIGSSNDNSYNLGNVYQGEEVWSPKIKLINSANTTYKINFSISIISGNQDDVSFEIWNENKTIKFLNPYNLKNGYTYFYIKHKFSNTAQLGNYTFVLEIIPIE